jgi:hypothetical protein
MAARSAALQRKQRALSGAALRRTRERGVDGLAALHETKSQTRARCALASNATDEGG